MRGALRTRDAGVRHGVREPVSWRRAACVILHLARLNAAERWVILSSSLLYLLRPSCAIDLLRRYECFGSVSFATASLETKRSTRQVHEDFL